VREGKINPDKPTGPDIRFDRTTGRGRGIELDQSPYNLDVDEVCRVAATAAGLTEPVELPCKWPVQRAIIVTYRIKMLAIAAIRRTCRWSDGIAQKRPGEISSHLLQQLLESCSVAATDGELWRHSATSLPRWQV
jgi:hypothetical protein